MESQKTTKFIKYINSDNRKIVEEEGEPWGRAKGALFQILRGPWIRENPTAKVAPISLPIFL